MCLIQNLLRILNGLKKAEPKTAPLPVEIQPFTYIDPKFGELVAMIQSEVAEGIAKGDLEERLKMILPNEAKRNFAESWIRQADVVESILFQYAEKGLIPLLYGHQRFRRQFKTDGRCPECDGVYQKYTDVRRPVTDHELHMLEARGDRIYTPACSTEGCGNYGESISTIASINIALPEKEGIRATSSSGLRESRNIAQEIHWRRKSSGRYLNKLVDLIRGRRETIVDYAAARIITVDGNASMYVLDALKRAFSVNGNGRIDIRNMDSQTGATLKPERYGFAEIVVPYQDIDIETKIRTAEQHYQEEHDPSLRHLTYVERQDRRRQSEWDGYDHLLAYHLFPIFAENGNRISPKK